MTSGVDRAPTEVAELADQIVGAVTGCPDVAGLAEIPGIPVATYLPGRTVSGVAVRPLEVEVCVIARYGLPLPQIAAKVREAVAPLVPGRAVNVVIADITSPEERPRPEEPPGDTGRRSNRKREESANG